MYESIDDMLCEVFYIKNTLIMGKSNSARIEEWIKSKGVIDRGTSGLTQHDLHANSAMILSRVENILNDIEWTYIQAEYGYDLSGIIDLTNYIVARTNGLSRLESDTLLEYLFVGQIKQSTMQDKFNWSKGKLYRKIRRIKLVINRLHNNCIIKLESKMESYLSKNM
ncbi:hypothetical protein BHC43_00325 [Snodgrassella alvi]|uniref:hypothetical protein n=1 Tax=Snodgrassella alvi TaxID=1196083 RepID=UPI000C1E1B0C|nr:hypothetical protein [Snodgrassella alvi]PIT41854.1 hypothetical protein BHC43_00325 [Snodgrassella alvi]